MEAAVHNSRMSLLIVVAVIALLFVLIGVAGALQSPGVDLAGLGGVAGVAANDDGVANVRSPLLLANAASGAEELRATPIGLMSGDIRVIPGLA